LYEINIKGAIFCQVIKIKLLIQLSPSITPGNQKWKGAAPLFSNKVDKINKLLKLLLIIQLLLKNNIIKIMANNKIDEAKAWVKKYFNLLSDVIRFFLPSFIKGINESKLISNPIQAPNQELEEIVIKVPEINIIRKILFEIFLIKKKRIITFISGVWTQ